jgi:hypothetical protein
VAEWRCGPPGSARVADPAGHQPYAGPSLDPGQGCVA